MVGTDHHPFDRLVAWIDGWLESRAVPVDCLVQHGTSAPPRLARGRAYLDPSSIGALMGTARVVVSHGGPATISEARRFGHRPVVIPRNSRLGEHVDDHQMRFTRRLAQAGLIDVVETADDLASAIESRLEGVLGESQSTAPPDATQAARRFGEVVDEILRSR